jgi:hypothetical protein
MPGPETNQWFCRIGGGKINGSLARIGLDAGGRIALNSFKCSDLPQRCGDKAAMVAII